MTKKQKIILLIGGGLLVLRLLFPVLHVTYGSYEYGVFNFAPFFETCEYGNYSTLCKIDFTRTELQIFAIMVVIAILWFLSKDRPGAVSKAGPKEKLMEELYKAPKNAQSVYADLIVKDPENLAILLKGKNYKDGGRIIPFRKEEYEAVFRFNTIEFLKTLKKVNDEEEKAKETQK